MNEGARFRAAFFCLGRGVYSAPPRPAEFSGSLDKASNFIADGRGASNACSGIRGRP